MQPTIHARDIQAAGGLDKYLEREARRTAPVSRGAGRNESAPVPTRETAREGAKNRNGGVSGVPTEAQEQRELIGTLAALGIHDLVHIPNGGALAGERGRGAALGVRPGFPDLFWPRPSGTAPGLFIELKRVRGGQVSQAQAEWHALLRGRGYVVEVCRGCEVALDAMRGYLPEAFA